MYDTCDDSIRTDLSAEPVPKMRPSGWNWAQVSSLRERGREGEGGRAGVEEERQGRREEWRKRGREGMDKKGGGRQTDRERDKFNSNLSAKAEHPEGGQLTDAGARVVGPADDTATVHIQEGPVLERGRAGEEENGESKGWREEEKRERVKEGWKEDKHLYKQSHGKGTRCLSPQECLAYLVE